METKATAVAPMPDLGTAQPQPAAAASAKSESPPAAQGSDPTDVRLVIEMDQASGSFVYKTIDRRTGEVVLQLPRAEVLKMRDGGEYEAGAVISTKA